MRRMILWWKSVKRELLEWWQALLRAIPGDIGCHLRIRFYGFHSGPGTRILQNVIVYYPERLRIGSRVGIATACQLNAAGGIEIGDDTLIGPGCYLWSQNHLTAGAIPISQQGYEQKRIIVGRDVWLGAGVIVLPGVNIADGTVVAAGAVVSRDTEPYSVVAGVPAHLIRNRIPENSEFSVQCHLNPTCRS